MARVPSAAEERLARTRTESRLNEPTPPLEFPGGVTVLMAVYGRDDPELFRRAVSSVYANSVVPDQFALVVDGPVPASLEAVIRDLAEEHDFDPLWLPETKGLAVALNCGLERVRTEWVARADADDVNVPDRFAIQVRAIRDCLGEIDILGGAITEVSRSGDPIAIREVPLTHHEIVRRLRVRNPFNHMTVVFRTGYVRALGGYPEIHLKEDYALWATAIAAGARCRNLDDVLVLATAGRDMYRRRGGLKYARAELEMHRLLRRLGWVGWLSGMLTGAAKAAMALFPPALRGWIYLAFLRRSPRSFAERSA